MRPLLKGVFAAGLVLMSPGSSAELAAPNARGVAMGHLHYTVRDVEANLEFWIALGGRADMLGDLGIVSFPDVILILGEGEYSGTSHGAVVDHMAFRVQSIETVKAAGFELTYYDGYPGVASVRTPEGEMIELFDDTATNLDFTVDHGVIDAVADRHNRPLPVPITSHHIHLKVPEADVLKAKQWYVENFGAVAGKRWHYEAADLPGINLNFSAATEPTAPTRGRMMDHVGFEVANLEAFCGQLAEKDVRCEPPSVNLPERVRSAVVTDPWGTTIELTEGLSRLR